MFTATYWTGTVATVEASTLDEAYEALGYTGTDGSHLWHCTGEVTNRDGEIVVTIIEAIAYTDTLSVLRDAYVDRFEADPPSMQAIVELADSIISSDCLDETLHAAALAVLTN
jgi:hypothetical protein